MSGHPQAPTHPIQRMVVIVGIVALMAMAIIVSLRPVSPGRTGPKLIQADGTTYLACGGALWLPTEGTFKDPDATSYNVVFKDAKGREHDLKRVRMLKVTDLPSNAPGCVTSR